MEFVNASKAETYVKSPVKAISHASVLQRYDSFVRLRIRKDERSMDANGASANKSEKVTPIRATYDGFPTVFLAKDSETRSFDIDCFCCQYPCLLYTSPSPRD